MLRTTLLAVMVGVAPTLTLWAADAASPANPFNGKDLKGWKLKGEDAQSKWKVGVANLDANNPSNLVVVDAKDAKEAQLVNALGGGVDISTDEKFGDCTIQLEFMVPKGSNSGVYVMGEYEVQILDSFGKKDEELTQGDLGALYSAAKPKTNVAKAPGQWQTLEIVFEAPKFAGDKRVAPAKFVKVTLNGDVIHENVTVNGPTPGGLTGKEAEQGPLMFQGDHGAVAYRKLQITPK